MCAIVEEFASREDMSQDLFFSETVAVAVSHLHPSFCMVLQKDFLLIGFFYLPFPQSCFNIENFKRGNAKFKEKARGVGF